MTNLYKGLTIYSNENKQSMSKLNVQMSTLEFTFTSLKKLEKYIKSDESRGSRKKLNYKM